jgi:hypothetical protein
LFCRYCEWGAFLILFSANLLLLYKNATDFCMADFEASTSLSLLISFDRLVVKYLGVPWQMTG